MKRKKGKTACAAALAAVCILMGGGNRICTAEEYLPVLPDIENAEKTGGTHSEISTTYYSLYFNCI